MLGAWNVRRVYEANAAIDHTYDVHVSLDQLLGNLVDAETGQRGFIITGAPRYLEPYNAARDRIATRIDEARRLIADSPEQIRDLDILAATAKIKLDELQDTVRLRRDVGFDAAQQRVETDAGNARWTRSGPLSPAWKRAKIAF